MTTIHPHIRWTAKGTAFKIWCDINTYVEAILRDDPSLVNSNWYQRWNNIFNTALIGKPETPQQVASFVIANSPKATIYDCIKILWKLIPNLTVYLQVYKLGQRNGNVRYEFLPYDFQPVKST